MTIQIDKPELEALILFRMQSGEFESAEDMLWHALRFSTPELPDVRQPRPGQTLEEVFASVRGLADDIDFGRNSSSSRPLEL